MKREPPDWFGCGRVITQESWDAFCKARQEYYEKQDREARAELKRQEIELYLWLQQGRAE